MGGGHLSVNMSGIVLNKLLTDKTENLKFLLILIKKYVDDFFIITEKNKYTELLKILNDYHPRIKFTCEKPVNNTIRFLDMDIII